jgi:phosphohistidine phosphatase
MTTTLILMRHAQAVDRMETDDDFERGLTARGRTDSEAGGLALQAMGLSVDLALVSPAWRTRQTCDQLLPLLGEPDIQDPMALYHASTDMLERAVTGAFDQADSILLVGHNPGIGGFAHKLAMLAGARLSLPAGYPPATATVFQLPKPDLSEAAFLGIFNPKG